MIELTRVSKRFDGRRQVTALADISLSVAPGDLVSIVGPSGSGKSTLLNLIGGLDRPNSGEISLDGASLARLDDDGLTRVRRDKVGFIFQFFNLLPSLTCLENVAPPLHLRGRWTLTLCGIALGVALFVATHTANESVMFAFERTVDRIAGATEL